MHSTSPFVLFSPPTFILHQNHYKIPSYILTMGSTSSSEINTNDGKEINRNLLARICEQLIIAQS